MLVPRTATNTITASLDHSSSGHTVPRRTLIQSMVTVKTGKQAFYCQRDMALAEAYAYTARVMTENLLMRDAEEGISAFIGKREPNWTDEP